MAGRIIDDFKKLPDYQDGVHGPLIENILNRFRKKGIESVDDYGITTLFARLMPQNTNIEIAYQILQFIENFLIKDIIDLHQAEREQAKTQLIGPGSKINREIKRVEAENERLRREKGSIAGGFKKEHEKHVAKEIRDEFIRLSEIVNKTNATIKLLNECPISTSCILKITDHLKEADGLVDISDLLRSETLESLVKMDTKSCDEKTITQPENAGKDSILQRLQKRLYQASIHVDSSGFIYQTMDLVRSQKGDRSKAVGEAYVTSLISSIDYLFVLRYLFIVKALKEHKPQHFFEKIASYIIEPTHAEKFQPLIVQLPANYIGKNYPKLNKMFEENTLCQEVVEDKEVLAESFARIPANKLKNLMPDDQLVLLSLFRFNRKGADIKAIWASSKAPPLQAIITAFEQAEFGFKQPNGYPPALVQYVIHEPKKNVIARIGKFIEEAADCFEGSFVANFRKKYATELGLVEKPSAKEEKKAVPIPLKPSSELKQKPETKEKKSLFEDFGFDFEQAQFAALEAFRAVQEVEEYERSQSEQKEKKVSGEHKSEEKKSIAKPIQELIRFNTLRDVVIHQSSSTIHSEMAQKLLDYRNHHLEDGFDEKAGETIFKGKGLTPNARGLAYVQFRNILMNSDCYWEKFNKLISDFDFCANAGYYDTKKALSSLTAPIHSLWSLVHKMEKRLQVQEEFFSQFTNDELLIQLISDDECFKALNHEDLAIIYQRCNRSLFLDLLVKYNRVDKRWKGFPVYTIDGIEHILNIEMIKRLTNPDEFYLDGINKERLTLGIAQYIPEGYQLPGIKENEQEESKERRFQYNEVAMNTAECRVIKKHLSQFINHFAAGTVSLEEKQNGRKDNPISFYYIPTTLDPLFLDTDKITSKDLKIRCENYRNNLRAIIDGYKPKREEKPVVFCGVINQGGNHWIPFFIYKNRENKIQVICLNPSAQSRHWVSPEELKKTPDARLCPKQKVDEQLRKIFGQIFPGCSFYDPNVTQQVRQRDCGPNSLTVICDVLDAPSHYPVLEIRKDDVMIIHQNRLSINFSTVNFRTLNALDSLYYYSPKVLNLCQETRNRWTKELQQETKFTTLSMTPHFGAECSFTALEDFNYEDEARQQQSADQYGELIGYVSTALNQLTGVKRFDNESIRESFVAHLRPTDEKLIVECILKLKTQYPAVVEMVESKGGNLNKIIYALWTKNLRPHFVDAIFNQHRQFFTQYPLKSAHEPLDNIIDAFVSSTDIYPYYKELSESEKLRLKNVRIRPATQDLYQEKVLEFHKAVVVEKITSELAKVILEMKDPGVPFNMQRISADVIDKFRQRGDGGDSFEFLLRAHSQSLQALITSMMNNLVLHFVQHTSAALNEKISQCTTLEAIHQLGQNGITLLSPQFISLLPPQEQKRDTIVTRTKLVIREEYNLFARLMASKVDESLKTTFDQTLFRLVEQEIKTEFKRVDAHLTGLSISELSKIMKDDIYAQEISSAIDLYKPLRVLDRHPLYIQTIQKVTQLLRQQIKASLQTKLAGSFEFLETNFYSLGKAHLDVIYKRINQGASPQEIIQQILFTLNLQRSKLPLLAEMNDPNTFQVFVDLYGQQLINKLRAIHEESTALNLDVHQNWQMMNLIHQTLRDPSEDKKLQAFNEKLKVFDTISRRAKECMYAPNALEEIQRCQSELQHFFQDMIGFLRANYKEGDINPGPGQFTVRARRLLCQILNITNNERPFPVYISGQDALEIDKRIAQQLTQNPTKPALLRLEYSMPLYVDPHPEELITRGQRMTPNMLCLLAANWLRSYDKDMLCGKPIHSIALSMLFTRLNALPRECKPNEILSEEWCLLNIKPILENLLVKEEIRRDKISEAFIFALANFVNFVPADEQKKQPEKDNIIKISHLKDVLGLYQRQKMKHSFDDYVIPIKIQIEKAQTEWKTPFQRGFKKTLFNKKSNELELLTECFEKIKRRHGVKDSTEFNLDRGDILILQELLQNRWRELCSKNRNPDNYLTFSHSSDNIYLLVALLLKDALQNFGVETYAYELLMPGRIQKGAIPQVAKEVKESGLTSIDDIYFKDVITLPHGRWVSKGHLIHDYDDDKGLRNVFTGEELKKGDIQHVIEFYPDIAKALGSLVKAKISNPFKDEKLKRVCLKFIKNSVFYRGFASMYTGDENKKFEAAKQEFDEDLLKLPPETKETLFSLKVPGKSITLGQSFKQGGCITGFGSDFAKVMLYYCPDLSIADFGEGIVRREKNTHEFSAVPRLTADQSKDIGGAGDTSKLNEAEKMLYDFMIAGQVPLHPHPL